MSKQTAVDWLTKKLWDEFGFAFSNNILEKAKAIEKQQIVDAYAEGHSLCRCVTDNTEEAKEISEQYYSQTYKQS